jgi:hypothetical protein
LICCWRVLANLSRRMYQIFAINICVNTFGWTRVFRRCLFHSWYIRSGYFRHCAECSDFSDNVQTMFRMFSQCSECSESVQNFQSMFRMFRIFSQCSECSESVQTFSEFLAQKLVYSEFLDFVVSQSHGFLQISVDECIRYLQLTYVSTHSDELVFFVVVCSIVGIFVVVILMGVVWAIPGKTGEIQMNEIMALRHYKVKKFWIDQFLC